ncbi:uncharacterized protein HMPREF1541_00466 [Cyphellophora europaea CBS 101466]|uniref:Uncharacterized protein n=1 Tax=Cyphellophora europaea (strain CBS 101466) TaxID=1220924 RepID=W2SC49_CYPE1|nr:uncharacterized protein HMPREF1541_00466 [Cyphellophora europaea CBS 101466]ETN46282.1 hypothetical protein HMPREF1541_00466 [Cyphellophora europaea CBS 101466]
MPKLNPPDLLSDQENIDPDGTFPHTDFDRAQLIAADTHRDFIFGRRGQGEEDDSENAFDDPSATPFDMLSQNSNTISAPTPSQAMTYPISPLIEVEIPKFAPVPASDEDAESINEPEEEPNKKAQNRKFQTSSTTRNKKRKASGVGTKVDETPDAGRRSGLRVRTSAQKNPFTADKLKYEMTKSRGRNISKAEVEKHMKQAQAPMLMPPAKKPKTNHAVAYETEDESEAVSSPVPSEAIVVSNKYILQQTTLCIAVVDCAGTIEAPLVNFERLNDLINYIDDRWGRQKGGRYAYMKCERPWKGKDHDLVIHRGWDEQFDQLIKSIREAPIWKKKSLSQRRLDVVIKVSLVDESISDP